VAGKGTASRLHFSIWQSQNAIGKRGGTGRQETILKILSDLILMCQSWLRNVSRVAVLLHVPPKTQRSKNTILRVTG